jgi:DNA-binding NarL/FixJ family response regulator
MSMEEAIACAFHEDRPAKPTASTGRLTHRESEVAALVAEGLTNLQIADRLVLSERPVESHVSNVLRKLNLNTRTRLAGWAVEQRLPVTST